MDFVARQYGFGEKDPPVVIAEIGVNHNGDAALAHRLIDVAADAGADIAKLQVFKTELEISRFAALAPYQRETSAGAANQFELCKKLELPLPALDGLKRHCAARGIGFLCSVFDAESLAFLVEELEVHALKIGSGEVTNTPLLERIGGCRVGAILSTGGCTLGEVADAVATLRAAGCPEIVLLHCVSSYPAPAAELNLRAIDTMKRRFALPVGFSDHSTGTQAAIAAAALGAVAIEKHVTLDHGMPGPDHRASADPAQLAALVPGVRAAHSMLGSGVKQPAACELANLLLIRRGLVARGSLRKGDRLTRERIEIKRPAHGIAPCALEQALGRQLSRDLQDDEPITWASLAP
jgi:N,N'-diacetyllegionaminate synthase